MWPSPAPGKKKKKSVITAPGRAERVDRPRGYQDPTEANFNPRSLSHIKLFTGQNKSVFKGNGKYHLLSSEVQSHLVFFSPLSEPFQDHININQHRFLSLSILCALGLGTMTILFWFPPPKHNPIWCAQRTVRTFLKPHKYKSALTNRFWSRCWSSDRFSHLCLPYLFIYLFFPRVCVCWGRLQIHSAFTLY